MPRHSKVAMRGANLRWCGLHVYTGFLCIALALYAMANLLYSTHSPVKRQEAPSLPLLFSSQRHCETASLLPAGEKYMLYAPHSGFSNQVGELKNALLIAALLNRTLVLPPIFDHHAVALGSCPKFRVHEPKEMRELAWAHISDLIRQRRYFAMADVLDLSSLASLVKLVDLRIFSLLWCGVDVSSACLGSFCRRLTAQSSIWGTLEGCGELLSRPEEAHGSCVYAVNEDCRTTIWVYGVESTGETSRSTDSFPALQVPAPNQSFSNKKMKERYGRKSFKDIVETLGIGSEADEFQVLSFGSLFSSEYKGAQLHVDIASSKDPKVRTLVEAMKFIPFTPAVVNAGKVYAKEKIRRPFFCAQLRLLDGQFKNHWEKTFANLRSQLEGARNKQGASQLLDLFVMTDLPRSNWSQTYLGELDANMSSYRLYTIGVDDPLIRDTMLKVANDEYGLRTGFLPALNDTFTDTQGPIAIGTAPDFLLFVEEVVCSCASLGFVGTSGSTLSENIVQLRMGNICAVST